MGQKAKANEFNHMATFQEEVSVDDFREIVKKAVELARAGEAESRAWIGAYCMGRPKDTPCRLSGIDTAERQEIESNELLNSLFPPKRERK